MAASKAAGGRWKQPEPEQSPPASANWTGPCTIWAHWSALQPPTQPTRRRLRCFGREGQESERSKPSNRRLPLKVGQTDRASSDRQGEAVGGCMPPQLKTPPELLFLTPTTVDARPLRPLPSYLTAHGTRGREGLPRFTPWCLLFDQPKPGLRGYVSDTIRDPSTK